MQFAGWPDDSAKPTSSSADSYTWALLAIILLGTALRLYQLTVDSLWLDEITTALFIQEPDIPGVLSNLTSTDRPLHFALAYLIAFAGDGEFWLRLPSVAFGILGLVTTYKLGQLLFGRMEGLLAAFLLAVSPFHIHYSQEGRSYALFMWLSLLTLYFFLQAWHTGHWRWWIGFTAASILNTYTHYFSAFVLAAEVVAAGILLVVDSIQAWNAGESCRKAIWGREGRFFASMLASLLVIALALLPSWPHLQAFLGRQSGATSPTRGLDLTVLFFAGVFKALTVGTEARTMPLAVNAWPFLIFLLLGVVTCLQQCQQRALVWASVWIVLPFAVLFAIPSKHFFVPHYVIFVLPLGLLLVARGVTGVGVWLNRLAGLRMAVGSWLVPAFGMVALLAFCVLEILPLKTYYTWEKEDWRSATAYLEAHAQPGDVIVCDGIQRGGQDSFRPCRALRYYFGSAFEENLVTRETGVAQTIESIAQEERGVWGLVFADLQGWTPGTQGISVAAFALTGVLQTEDSSGNVLDKSIALLESFPEFMTEQGRFDVHMELGKLYTIQGDMDRAYEHLQLARAVMPEDTRATRAWTGFYAWFRQREFRR